MRIIALFAAAVLFAGHVSSARAQSTALTDWSGFYAGLQAGYSWGEAEFTGKGGLVPVATGYGSFDIKGFDGGIFIGYSRQYEKFVFGIEADINLGGPDGTGSMSSIDWCGAATPCTPSIDEFWNYDVEGWGSVRARAGYEVHSGALFYVTGGISGARTHWYNDSPNVAPGSTFDPDIGPDLDFSETVWGYTIGGGFEVQHGRFRIKGEVLYTDLGDTVYAHSGTDTLAVDVDFVTARIGISVPFPVN